ncbi:hypothetical protein [Dysgonomonas sp. UBA7710]|uniref:hypothetical protein n=2 Tax=unclassified Dysgonomonas TaxID=2630389 RepID=UPI0025C618CF|nr:hypothetical protein [Dysgonomonas sp. UBA7710]
MQNETKNQGCIPRRPKTAASVGQNNTESSLAGLSAGYSSYRILPYTSALRIGYPACGTRPESRCDDRTKVFRALAARASAAPLALSTGHP